MMKCKVVLPVEDVVMLEFDILLPLWNLLIVFIFEISDILSIREKGKKTELFYRMWPKWDAISLLEFPLWFKHKTIISCNCKCEGACFLQFY